jgi:hypothetical protein
MSEPTDRNVTTLPEKPKRFSITKQKAIKVGAATAATVLGVVYLKRKLNCNCSVSANAHVETADNDTNN